MDPFFAKMVGFSAAAVACSAAYLTARYSLFRKVTWAFGPMDGFTYVYVDHVGPYKTVGKAFEKLQAEMQAAGTPVEFERDRFVGAQEPVPPCCVNSTQADIRRAHPPGPLCV